MSCAKGRVPRHDFHLRRGDSATIVLRFRTLSQTGATRLLDLAESDITLAVEWPGGGLVRRSGNGGLAVDARAGTVAWRPEPVETRAIPEGRVATYRLVREVAEGERRTLLTGFVIGAGTTGEGGDADDV
ncbi:hypothetical protein ACFFJ7_12560 [Pseudochelatococcus lubricantis]|uniref:hypothetical protein n=1 Tax=Pseudochelatococcus lubricantis TaxID=1538102 RepID=UPI0035E655D9